MNDLISAGTDLPVSLFQNPLLDTQRFAATMAVAEVMAMSSLIPDSIRFEGSGNDKKELAYEIVKANCFLITNQSFNWGLDAFAVAQCCSVVHGRLMFEGKLVASVLEAKLRIKMHFEYGKWDPSQAICLVGEEYNGDDLAIRIGEFDHTAGAWKRFVDGYVGGWKTTGANSAWSKASDWRKMLFNRGTREWARLYEPGVMLGIMTDDEADFTPMRDITPARAPAQTGASVLDRIKQSKTDTSANAGFDHDRIKGSTSAETQTSDKSDQPVSNEGRSEGDGEQSSSPDTSNSQPSDASSDAAAKPDDAESSPASSGTTSQSRDDELDAQWLRDVVIMFWAATNVKGDMSVLVNQRKAAAVAYDHTGVGEQYLKKATRIFESCEQVVKGEADPEVTRKYISQLAGLDKNALGAKK